ncbi:JNK-interacting protein 3 [Papilio machaon]|uniref:JNK-interacting protein 3 n=1 Tax=Papilio machaon TaxID=76193 RepID=A0A194QUC9_PAPMA|nr:JNK-interacting protein 3 [Papilio machaon]
MNFENSSSSGYVTNETIYGTHEDSHAVMSEKVQSLAGSIYQEFERMIARYDEDVVKTLMPLLVNVLECLDSAYQTNQEHEVELELLREDNEQLVTQYEREKAARKHSEQKLLEAEDHFEGERKDLTGRLEALDSIVRMLELKHKNSLDHASRLEERENELKKEYAKLHERYTELFKTHMDYMERTKLLLSTAANDRGGEVRGRINLNNVSRSSGPISFGFASLEGSVNIVEQTESIPGSPVSLSSSPPSPPIGSELAAVRTAEQSHQTDPIRQQSQATSPVAPQASSGRSHTKSEKRSANTLYQELAFQDSDPVVEDETDITGNWVHPGEYASSSKEVENLILENNELLATKNALNVVKDDLIVKVDELTGEQEILREEVANLNAARETLRERVNQLEDELRRLKETVSSTTSGDNEDEADVPMAQRRRFTAQLYRSQEYLSLERFMELQDAVRWTEMVRATRGDASAGKKSKQSIWKFFSNLLNPSERPQRPLSTPHLRAVTAPQPALRHSRTQGDFLETQLTDQHHRRQDRNEQFRQIIDANNPAVVIETFTVYEKHILCIASVQGATDEDYKEFKEREAELKNGGKPQFHCSEEEDDENGEKKIIVGRKVLVDSILLTPSESPVKEKKENEEKDAEETASTSQSPPLSSTPINNTIAEVQEDVPEQGVAAYDDDEIPERLSPVFEARTSTIMPTMWLGTKSGNLYIHSAVVDYKKCISIVKMNDAILSIVSCSSRCLVALADGTVAIFSRDGTGQWNLKQYLVVTLGDPKCSVRCLCVVGNTVWCGYRNKVHVVEPRTGTLVHTLEAHPRHESQVRQMACDGDGVWVSIKMDSALRLYHAHTYQHLRDVDIEPYVSKMLGTGKLGFSFVRITALLISSGRLWIGTSNGVVISVPLSDTQGSSRDSSGGTTRHTAIANTSATGRVRPDSTSPTGSIPWCSMAQAQLSFHGHRDAVTFFVAVPGNANSPTRTPDSPQKTAESPQKTAESPQKTASPPMLVMSGGEGYIDFRIADSEMEDSVVVAEDGSSGHSSLAERATKSHLIVWQVATA